MIGVLWDGLELVWQHQQLDAGLRRKVYADYIVCIKHGQGHYISSSGYEYGGEWVSGKQTGKAFIKYKNGDVYEGHVLGGLRSGTGELLQNHTQRCFKGSWKYNGLVGEFKLSQDFFV